MAQIYRDTTGVGLAFGVTDAVVTKAEFKRNGETVASYDNASTVQVPYSITKSDGPFYVLWTYTLESATHTRLEEHEIVTPHFTKSELVAWDPDFTTLSNEKVAHLESLVRHIIETYTNQKFGYRQGSVLIEGNGSRILYSPERIIALSTVGYTNLPDGYGIHVGSSSLNNVLNVKIPIEEEVVNDPFRLKAFTPGRMYMFSGVFGWLAVPEQVKEAALHLAEAFSCNESLWRERYIKSIRAADWRFDYSEETFRSTGSLVADQLLDPYVKIGFAAV